MRRTDQTKKPGFRKGRVAAAVAAVLLITALAPQSSFAEPDLSNCSITVESPSAEGTTAYDDLKNATVKLDVYQIAKAAGIPGYDTFRFDWSGSVFTQMKAGYNALEEASKSGTLTADDVNAFTQTAAGLVLAEGSGISPVLEGQSLDSPFTVPGGLYLIIAHGDGTPKDYVIQTGNDNLPYVTTSKGSQKLYEFAPMLVSVPTRGEENLGEGSIVVDETDWAYAIGDGNTAREGAFQNNIAIKLKVGVGNQPGKLRIEKILPVRESMDNRLDPATFVFRIKAEYEDKTVYNDVASILFDGIKLGDPIVIENLPVGAKVRVTEEYPGGDYTFASATAFTSDNKNAVDAQEANWVEVTIIADDESTEPEELVIAQFTNTYNDTWNGEGSVTNKFALNDDNWNVTPEYANASEKAD